MPHPSLHPSNLSRLPSHLRHIAIRAYHDTHDTETSLMEEIYQHVSREILDANAAPSVLFLPVFYAALGPPPADASSISARTFWALKCMNEVLWNSSIPCPFLTDCWPRLWQWIIWHHRAIAPTPDGLENNIIALHLSILRRAAFLDEDLDVLNPIVDQTPDVRVILTEMWVHFVHDKRLRDIQNPAEDMDNLLFKFMQVTTPANLEAVVEGAGGTVLDLGLLVVTHLGAIVFDDYVDLPLKTISFILRLVTSNQGTVLKTFVTQGLTRKLVAVLEMLENQPKASDILSSPEYEQCCVVLTMAITTNPGLPWVVEGLKAGLILGLTNVGRRDIPEDHALIPILRQMFGILAGYLNHHSVLRCLRRDFAHFERYTRDTPQSSSNYCSPFVALAQDRLRLNDAFDSRKHSVIFCDNMACQLVSSRRDFHRCSRCSSTYYCSPECQRADWGSGVGHKNVCRSSEHQDDGGLPKKDKAFLRFIIHEDYKRDRQKVFELRVHFMRQTGAPFYTQFDYTRQPVLISVLPADRLMAQMRSPAEKAQLTDKIHRMSVSGGKMQLDVAVIPSGRDVQHYIFPLRTNSSRIHDTLKGLVRTWAQHEIPQEESSVMLRSLADELEEQADLVEIHCY
ncbi:hypothetical protein C8R44DRAFT_759219 [Mycena epipterygia]|nr:hypothetical protein C8R44DRAFT_759219 [Mycena epipterygia]